MTGCIPSSPIPEDRTTDSAEGAADQPSLARPVEEIRADLARAASPYYCGGGPVADRLATDAASLLSRLAAVEREAAELRAEVTSWQETAEGNRQRALRVHDFDSRTAKGLMTKLTEARRRAVAAEARIEAAQKRPWLVDLVNLTQQECYDKGRADVLAALVSPLPPEDTTNRATSEQASK